MHVTALPRMQVNHTLASFRQSPLEGTFGGRDISGGKLNGGSVSIPGMYGGSVKTGEGATGAQLIEGQEFAEETHSNRAAPRDWHDEQQEKIEQDAWRSSQGDPVVTWSDLHAPVPHSNIFVKMHRV